MSNVIDNEKVEAEIAAYRRKKQAECQRKLKKRDPEAARAKNRKWYAQRYPDKESRAEINARDRERRARMKAAPPDSAEYCQYLHEKFQNMARNAQRRAQDPEGCRAYMRQWRQENPEKNAAIRKREREREKERRRTDPAYAEKKREYKRQWRKNNPEKEAAQRERAKARRKAKREAEEAADANKAD